MIKNNFPIISKFCGRTAYFYFAVINYRNSLSPVRGGRYRRYGKHISGSKTDFSDVLLFRPGIERKPGNVELCRRNESSLTPAHCGRKGKEMRVSGWLSATRETFRTVYRFSRELRVVSEALVKYGGLRESDTHRLLTTSHGGCFRDIARNTAWLARSVPRRVVYMTRIKMKWNVDDIDI